jgi:hypothetical protein
MVNQILIRVLLKVNKSALWTVIKSINYALHSLYDSRVKKPKRDTEDSSIANWEIAIAENNKQNLRLIVKRILNIFYFYFSNENDMA